MASADILLQGPRGRRLCLAAAVGADEGVGSAVFWAAHRLDPHPGTLLRIGDDGADAVEDPAFTPDDVAARIRRSAGRQITGEAAWEALIETVDHAMYWQEPAGSDVLTTIPVVRDALGLIADQVVTMIPRLTEPAASAQWAVDWRVETDPAPIERNPSAVLAAWSKEQRDDEARSAIERPADPHANWSGSWWSVPQSLLESRGSVSGALQLVEDSLGWEVATVIPVHGAGRILEIDCADVWAELCRAYPMEVTASRRHDWFRVTGRNGRWLIPDWERVAQRWDAVHLTTLGYLSSATQRIDIDDEYASVIAGWGPDSTIWLGDVAREREEPREQWERAQNGRPWTRVDPAD